MRLAQLMPPLRVRTGGSARQAPQCEGIGARDGRPGVAGRRRRARAGDRLRVRLPAGLASWHPPFGSMCGPPTGARSRTTASARGTRDKPGA